MTSDLLEDLRATTRQALSAGGDDVVDQLDLAAMLLDAEHGGLALREREMVLVAEEIGRSAAASSFLSTVVLGATLLREHHQPPSAVVIAGADGSWESVPSSVRATADTDGRWRLQGAAWAVTTPSAPRALVTAATTDTGVALFELSSDDVALVAADEFDPGRGLVEVTFGGATARRIVEPAEAAERLATAHRRTLLAVAAEQLGVARACLQTTVDYARTRTQFGAPIGSFQAIKHRCADTLLGAELAAAVLHQAVASGTRTDAELAFVVANRAAVTAAEANIHVHGGIGFTWEHSAHRYLRRARTNATLLGAPGLHRNVIAESAGLSRIAGP